MHESRSVLSYMRRCCCCFLCSCCCDGDRDVARDNTRKQRVKECAVFTVYPPRLVRVEALLAAVLLNQCFSKEAAGVTCLYHCPQIRGMITVLTTYQKVAAASLRRDSAW